MEEIMVDIYNGKPIRRTENGLKEGDLRASQEPKPLELDKNGLPVGWEAPDGNA